jgi:cephalosporin-C deacetylase
MRSSTFRSPSRALRRKNPRPADFDAYWERALGEMRSVEPKVSSCRRVPAEFECFDLWFTGVRGARSREVPPAETQRARSRPARFGYSGNSGDFRTSSLGGGWFLRRGARLRRGGKSNDARRHARGRLNGHIIRTTCSTSPTNCFS